MELQVGDWLKLRLSDGTTGQMRLDDPREVDMVQLLIKGSPEAPTVLYALGNKIVFADAFGNKVVFTRHIVSIERV